MSRWNSTRQHAARHTDGRHRPHAAVRTLLILFVAAILLAGTSCITFGAERETKAFDVDVKVNVDNSYEFTETLDTVFHSSGHGIFRYIPIYFNGTKEKVGSEWVDGMDYDSYMENNNLVLQIGSADVYIYGPQTFRYGYKITMLDDRDTSSDLLYMNVLPTSWQTPIESSTITMHLPKSIKGQKMRVYYGTRGSTEEVPKEGAGGISWTYDDEQKTITIKGKDLAQGVGITVMADLPEGYWEGQANTDWMKYLAAALMLLLGGGFAGLWALFGRNRGFVETVEFYPPEGMTPAEVGYLADGSLDKKDMVSMFMYYAEKGYMTIAPSGEKDFVITKLADIDEGEKKFARVLFQGIFGGKVGQQKKLSDLGPTFARRYQSAKSALDDSMEPVTMGTKVIHIIMKALMLVIPVAIGSLAVGYNASFAASGVELGYGFLAVVFTLILCRCMRKRRIHEGIMGKLPFIIVFAALDLIFLAAGTSGIYEDLGSMALAALYFVVMAAAQFFTVIFYKVNPELVHLMGRLLGLRRFIRTAEKPRIDALVEENPNYFYDILPYAYVMGVTNKWAKNFEHVNVEPPVWYGGSDMPVFNTIYFAHLMGHFGSTVSSNATFTIPDTSSNGGFSGGSGGGFSGGFSGGFGGGGFSGGGGGGGGGGFW